MFRKLKNIKNKFYTWLYEIESIEVGEFNKRLNFTECKIYDHGSLKFTAKAHVNGYYVKTPTGYSKILNSFKTVDYVVYRLELVNGYTLLCADKHIVINSDNKQVFVKDLIAGDLVKTDQGISSVLNVTKLDQKESMCDLELDDKNHVYYTNGILSHNTITVASFLLWFGLFHKSKTIAVLANKLSQAREIMSRITTAFECIPFFLQSGTRELNKGTIKFSNGSELFCAATSSSSIRGRSCVTSDTLIKVRNKETKEIKDIPIGELYNNLDNDYIEVVL